MDDQDWRAAMSSEIFREFVAAELRKEAFAKTESERVNAQKAEQELTEKERVLEAMDVFEEKLKQSPELLAKFKTAKQTLLSNPQLIEKVDSNFVNGLMMLDLGD